MMKIKKCPGCGSIPYKQDWNTGDGVKTQIVCDCGMKTAVGDLEDVATCWNRRKGVEAWNRIEDKSVQYKLPEENGAWCLICFRCLRQDMYEMVRWFDGNPDHAWHPWLKCDGFIKGFYAMAPGDGVALAKNVRAWKYSEPFDKPYEVRRG